MSMSLSSTDHPTLKNLPRMPNLSADMEWLSPVSAWALDTCVDGEGVVVGGIVGVVVGVAN